MATAEMSLPDKKPEHESGYYEGSDQEGSMECTCPSPVSSRNSSHSAKLKRRHSNKHKKSPCKKARVEPPVNGHSINDVDKSVEIVECSNLPISGPEVFPLPGPSTKRSSSVELIGGPVPAPARDSVDWNLVDASKIRKRNRGESQILINLVHRGLFYLSLILRNVAKQIIYCEIQTKVQS